MFTGGQLILSLQASLLYEPALHALFVIDDNQLCKDIWSGLSLDPVITLILEVCARHDHPLAGHFGQTKTMALVFRDYTWPKLQGFVLDFCKSCTTCGRVKAPQHRPYGTLKQLPIPEKPWNSILMDFIEQLPESSGFTAILVVVDRFMKQGIFILMTNEVNSVELACLFVLHIFLKHGFPSHVTSDHSSKFISHFFHSLGKVLDMTLHFTSRYRLEGNGQTVQT